MQIEGRLLGTWQSDQRRTLAELMPCLPRRSKKRQVFASMFGHLRLRFTRSQVLSEFKGQRERARYRVLGRDDDSVVILSEGPFGRRLQHIHFERSSYWVSIGPYREWFKRVR